MNFLRVSLLLFFLLSYINIVTSGNVKKSIDETDNEDEEEEEYESSFDIPAENENTNLSCIRRANSRMHEILAAKVMQFPFVGAIMSHQNEYLCTGSVVSNGLILTSAKCTQQAIGYVLLNTTRNKKDPYATMLHVIKTEKFPSFTGSDSLKDVGLIYAEKHNGSVASKIKLSNYTNARNLVDIEAIGFGLNADVGQIKELQYVGVELRSPLENADILKAYFDCVNTKETTCFKDYGGPALYNDELIGIVIRGQDECTKEMSATYAINKKMADILPTFTFKAWLDDRINRNEKGEPILSAFPMKPAARRAADINLNKDLSLDDHSLVQPTRPRTVQRWHPPPKPLPRTVYTKSTDQANQKLVSRSNGCVLKGSSNLLWFVFYRIMAIY